MHGAEGITLFPEARDAQAFLAHLGDISSRHSVEIHCYCLMDTHYHLLVRDARGGISAAMSQLNGWYSRRYNHRYGRRGPLFDGRFHRTLVEDEGHLRSCVRYIVRNPVDAGLCREPAGWAWSSHRATIGVAQRPWFLLTDLALGPAGTVEAYIRDVAAC